MSDREENTVSQQLGLFTTTSTTIVPAASEAGGVDRDPDWPHTTWRFGPGREIEYRHPVPTSPAPPPLLGGEWHWNPLAPGWQLDYPQPPLSLAPRGETRDRFGSRLLPPPGFIAFDRRRHAGRCSHCCGASGGRWGGPGWHGWSDPRVAAAFAAEEAAGRRCYGLTKIEVPALGLVKPLTHYTRWGAGYCTACGAISWNDFREPSSAYFRPPTPLAHP